MSVLKRIKSRPPDVTLKKGTRGDYMYRWHIIPRNRFFNIYLHNFNSSDDDRALHDHPWMNLSIILEGEYLEVTENAMTRRKKGNWHFRYPREAHRIVVYQPCWTLFITGPKVREWGFHCPQGWRHWKEFTDEAGTGVGKGCE